MEPEAVLELMKGYFVGKLPAETLDHLAEQSPEVLLKESLDVVDFLVYLEEELGREIDINEVGDAFRKATFRELSEEISQILTAA